jgi:hypothetical protein
MKNSDKLFQITSSINALKKLKGHDASVKLLEEEFKKLGGNPLDLLDHKDILTQIEELKSKIVSNLYELEKLCLYESINFEIEYNGFIIDVYKSMDKIIKNDEWEESGDWNSSSILCS